MKKIKVTSQYSLAVFLNLFISPFFIMVFWGMLVKSMNLNLPTLSYFQLMLVYLLTSLLFKSIIPNEYEIEEK